MPDSAGYRLGATQIRAWLQAHPGALVLDARELRDFEHANATGATCLMYAASSGKTAIVRALRALGADTTLRTQDDFSALDMASNLECLQALRVGAPRHPTP